MFVSVFALSACQSGENKGGGNNNGGGENPTQGTITISSTAAKIAVGGSYVLEILEDGLPYNGNGKVVWSTDNAAVATVYSGALRGAGEGTTAVKARFTGAGGRVSNFSCAVTVVSPLSLVLTDIYQYAGYGDISLAVTAPAGVSYSIASITDGGGAPVTGKLNGETFKNDTPGAYTVTYLFSGASIPDTELTRSVIIRSEKTFADARVLDSVDPGYPRGSGSIIRDWLSGNERFDADGGEYLTLSGTDAADLKEALVSSGYAGGKSAATLYRVQSFKSPINKPTWFTIDLPETRLPLWNSGALSDDAFIDVWFRILRSEKSDGSYAPSAVCYPILYKQMDASLSQIYNAGGATGLNTGGEFFRWRMPMTQLKAGLVGTRNLALAIGTTWGAGDFILDLFSVEIGYNSGAAPAFKPNQFNIPVSSVDPMGITNFQSSYGVYDANGTQLTAGTHYTVGTAANAGKIRITAPGAYQLRYKVRGYGIAGYMTAGVWDESLVHEFRVTGQYYGTVSAFDYTDEAYIHTLSGGWVYGTVSGYRYSAPTIADGYTGAHTKKTSMAFLSDMGDQRNQYFFFDIPSGLTYSQFDYLSVFVKASVNYSPGLIRLCDRPTPYNPSSSTVRTIQELYSETFVKNQWTELRFSVSAIQSVMGGTTMPVNRQLGIFIAPGDNTYAGSSWELAVYSAELRKSVEITETKLPTSTNLTSNQIGGYPATFLGVQALTGGAYTVSGDTLATAAPGDYLLKYKLTNANFENGSHEYSVPVRVKASILTTGVLSTLESAGAIYARSGGYSPNNQVKVNDTNGEPIAPAIRDLGAGEYGALAAAGYKGKLNKQTAWSFTAGSGYNVFRFYFDGVNSEFFDLYGTLPNTAYISMWVKFGAVIGPSYVMHFYPGNASGYGTTGDWACPANAVNLRTQWTAGVAPAADTWLELRITTADFKAACNNAGGLNGAAADRFAMFIGMTPNSTRLDIYSVELINI